MMIEPQLFDTIELLIDLPTHNLSAGAQGAIVHQHTPTVYEVEFTNEDGETIALCAVTLSHFIVIWQAATRQWVSVADQVAQIVARLPEASRTEVLRFARAASVRSPRYASLNS